MSIILMTTLFYKALVVEGEIWCWSLLEIKGLINGTEKIEIMAIGHLHDEVFSLLRCPEFISFFLPYYLYLVMPVMFK